MWKETENYLRVSRYMPTFARLGLGHLYFALGGQFDFGKMKEPQKSEMKVAWSSPEYFKSQYSENSAGRKIFMDAQKLGSLGNLPLIVITQGNETATPEWIELQNELAELSSHSMHITVEGATHASLAFDPQHAGIVSSAILQMVEALQTGKQGGL
jgi:hypothetical protein